MRNLVLLALLATLPASAQRSLAGAAAVKQSLDRARTTASVLMIGAHPDDENTALLATFARGRHLRAAYLSITRGEGGQNLIGSEQGPLMGVIRTQELLAARRIDGAEQFFTRAIDFGFSKTAAETLAKWGHDAILSDVVWVIRTFRPDVIVLRFSGTSRDGHGHHTASGQLGREAFRAAADPRRFPEQLKTVAPWQAKRLYWNTFGGGEGASAGRIDVGEFDSLLGFSYGEIAGMSRSQHRSQGFGAAERRGSMQQALQLIDGEPAPDGFLSGVELSWRRWPGGAAVAGQLDAAAAAFTAEAPEKVVPALAQARSLAAAIRAPEIPRKLAELDEAIALACGLWLDAAADRWSASPGSAAGIQMTALNRGREPVTLVSAALADGPAFPVQAAALDYNQPLTARVQWSVPASQPYTQPFWLERPSNGYVYDLPRQDMVGRAAPRAALTAVFRLRVAGTEIELTRPVEHRYVDRVRGELTRPFVIAPAVAVRVLGGARVFTDARPRQVEVEVEATQGAATGEVELRASAGWRVTPAAQPFQLSESGQQAVVVFNVTPPAASARGTLSAAVRVGGAAIDRGMTVIAYEHIPPQTLFPPAAAAIAREDVRVTARRAGYVMGAGDDVPEALRQMGCEVELLDDAALARGGLARFDVIVTGVRAWNTRASLRANRQRLMDYVAAGGALVVQYNTTDGGMGAIGPYPLRLGRDRVTVEEAPLTPLRPDHPLLTAPNKIGPSDFDGWVQERGLYFASDWDAQYETVLSAHDPGEKPLQGGLLYARHGKGVYIYTGLAFFRQLPAGVPGGWRLFANLISAGRAQ